MTLPANLLIRPATAADWPALAAMLEENALPRAGAREHLDDYLVADIGGVVAGSAGLECYGDAALLRSCVVDVRFRDMSLGKSLTQHAIDLARNRGIRQLFLLTTTAEDFFARRGFARIARESVPAALKTSAEFTGACPASAVSMQLLL